MSLPGNYFNRVDGFLVGWSGRRRYAEYGRITILEYFRTVGTG